MLDGSSFIKTGPVSALPMFEAEAEGLKELREAGDIRVPDVISCGVSEGKSYIALERLSLQRPDQMIERRFGEQLANLHRHTAAKFGWFRDNTIGPDAAEQFSLTDRLATLLSRASGLAIPARARRQATGYAAAISAAARFDDSPSG